MIYLIADAAVDPEIYGLVKASPDHTCLFAGPLDPMLARNAPYLVTLATSGALFAKWKRRGIGRSWGIFCESGLGLNELRRELRRSLQARLPDGRIVLFRYFDPRVWRTYIQSCDQADLARWFGGIRVFYAEDTSGSGLRAYRFDGALSVSVASVTALE